MDNIKQFFETANERHRIYVLKELGLPKPWTQDRIFQNSFFCNVFRDVDKTSAWIIDNLLLAHAGHPQLWASIIMCRMISRISTLEVLQTNNCLIGDYKRAYKILKEMQRRKVPIFTGAFIVNSAVGGGVWLDKVTYLFSTLNYFNKLELEGLDSDVINFNDYLWLEKSLYEVWKVFKQAPGIADFMAYQYTCDMTYTPHYLKSNIDGNEWTKLGLGAVRGMNRIISGEPSSKKIPDEIKRTKDILWKWRLWVEDNLENEIYSTWTMIEDKKHPSEGFDDIRVMYAPFYTLRMQDVQHWLCEYDKYCRGGSSKRKYNGKE